jgi:hypothetical protein
MESRHLKTIDVICLDQTGEVKKRYDEFITFKNYRFRAMTTEQYLGRICNSLPIDPENGYSQFVEKNHMALFSEPFPPAKMIALRA